MSAVATWLEQHAVPLSGTDPSLGDQDLLPLLDMFGTARLVGLGEASHGVREFFQLKHRIVSALSRDPLGLAQVHWESPLPGVLRTREWVQGGVGSLVAALRGLGFGIWRTDEVAALLEWLRTSASHVEVLGIDIQDPDGAVLALDGPDLQLASLTPDSWHDSSVDERSALVSRLHGVDSPLARSVRRWVEAGADHADGGHAVREMAMAAHLLEGLQTAGRSVVWAHNGHVSRGGMTGWNLPSMGQHLGAALGDDYVALGFVLGHGRISAYNETFDLGEHVVPRRSDPFHQALAGTASLFAVDLRRMPAEVHRQLAAEPPLIWEVGHTWYGPEAHERPVNLIRSYDVIIYLDEATPSRPYLEAFDA